MLKPPVQSRGQGEGAGLGGGRGRPSSGLQPSTSQTGEERRRGDQGESGGATSAAQASAAAAPATLHHERGHRLPERGVPQEVQAQRPQGQQRADLNPGGDEVPQPRPDRGQHPGLAAGRPARVLRAGLDTVPAPGHPRGQGELGEERVAGQPDPGAAARGPGQPWSRLSADVRHWQHSSPGGQTQAAPSIRAR